MPISKYQQREIGKLNQSVIQVTKTSPGRYIIIQSGCEISVRRNHGYFSGKRVISRMSELFLRVRKIKIDILTGQSECRRDAELWLVDQTL